MLLTVDVRGLKVDVFVVDVLKVNVLEVVQVGRFDYIEKYFFSLVRWLIESDQCATKIG